MADPYAPDAYDEAVDTVRRSWRNIDWRIFVLILLCALALELL